MVNSSFEWFPGIPIYKSRDLVNWKLIGYGVTRAGQADIPEGVGDSRGVYAVTIRHHEGVFYLITTNVQCGGNFYITATDPAGEWSDAVWLDSPGIDPSLFWDEDGTCYYTGHGVVNGPRTWTDQNGAWLQVLDLEQQKLVGERKQLTYGHATNARWTEGPHLYNIDGKYMLLVAEGGTGYHHGVTIFHSDDIWGPYEPNHTNPVITHRHLGSDFPVQAVGHCDIIETQKGDWWGVMLAKRMRDGYCYLARETFLTPITFEYQDGGKNLTPVFNPGVGHLSERQARPDLDWHPYEAKDIRDEFEGEKLDLFWNFLRTPMSLWHKVEKGALALDLRPEVADSLVTPSLVAQRMEHYAFRIATQMEFRSSKSNEEAGLIVYRTSQAHLKLVRFEDRVELISMRRGVRSVVETIACSKGKVVTLEAISDGKDLTFSFEQDGKEYKFEATLPLSIISDEEASGFNGPYVGVYASSNGKDSRSVARFNWFDYEAK